MKNFIKLGVLGLALSISLNASAYAESEESFNIDANQTNIALSLGNTQVSNVYNVKQAQDVQLFAPKGYMILVGNERLNSYTRHIEPQETLNISFNLVKPGDGIREAKVVNKIIKTFKEELKPKYQKNIMERYGKQSYRQGDSNYFQLKENQNNVLVELHEYNKGTKHDFSYTGVKDDIRFKLIAPKYHSFIFNDKPVKEYSFKAEKDKVTAFKLKIRADLSDNTKSYDRVYRFNLKQ